jgi:hypothetical protein
MDPAGAEALRLRLEQQRHWLLATAASDGRQAHVDPDLAALVEIRDNGRVYHDAGGRFAKLLLNGWWERVEIAESS